VPTLPVQAPRAAVQARRAAAAAFFTQGLVFISLTTRLPTLKDKWEIGEAVLSVLLLMMVLLAGLGSFVAEHLARTRSSAGILRPGLVGVGVGAAGIALAPDVWAFVAALAVYGVAIGVVDASTNMQAVAIEHWYGRPILPSFHGAWTWGGVVGAAVTLATSGLGPLVGIAVVPLVVAGAPFLDRVIEAVHADVPWRPLLLVGMAMVLFYMVDTAASTWGPTYLDTTFDTPERLVALATFPYLLATGLMRAAGDRIVATYGPVPVLRAGGVVAALALAVVVFAPGWPVAVAGFTLLGLGVAVIAPLSYSAAGRLAGLANRDAVIARFNQFNYVGALLGAVMTGLVGANSLRYGFALPMVLILAILPLARSFAPASQAAPPGQ
jgi:MFS family permease